MRAVVDGVVNLIEDDIEMGKRFDCLWKDAHFCDRAEIPRYKESLDELIQEYERLIFETFADEPWAQPERVERSHLLQRMLLFYRLLDRMHIVNQK
jgi:hypothetical protein